jgi:4-hydroxybenzoate polyprenyltransferase/phosphoserine phosphatase
MLPAAIEPKAAVPLCVDLDGTLIKTDLIWESIVRLLKRNPAYFFAILFWWTRGRAYLKKEVGRRIRLDAVTLPYNKEVEEFIRAQRQEGRRVILATASDEQLARQVADFLGCFDEVLASDGRTNMRAHEKARQLAERFGPRGFDYAGNSSVDLPVWEQAREAIVVSDSSALASRAEQRARISRVFASGQNWLRGLVKAARPHHWVKNLILFVPLLTAHKLFNFPQLLQAILGFAAFCLCASAVYILNDLLDIEADRHHPTKRSRPFASGEIALPVGLALIPLLLMGAVAFAVFLPWHFAAVLGIYALLTTTYSLRFKEVPLLDVFCLAALYTIRLIAGHEAAVVKYSFWLLVFSMFLFLSLALLKRFTELVEARQQSKLELKGRGYAASDLELVATLGSNSGYLAVLVMALYVNSPEPALYSHPILLLLICPLMLYWICRVWLLAHRGQMHEDPIVFALKDPVSYIVGALTLFVVWLAAVV